MDKKYADVCAELDGAVYKAERYKDDVRQQLDWLQANMSGLQLNPHHIRRLFDVARIRLGIRPKGDEAWADPGSQ